MLVSNGVLGSLHDQLGVEVAVADEDLLGNLEGSIDNFRHFAVAAGDDNPLWHDVAYAQRSPHHEFVAMPTWLNSVLHSGYFTQVSKPAELSALAGTHTWEFFASVRVADRFLITSELIELNEKTSPSLGPALILTAALNYRTSSGERLARLTCNAWWYDKRNTLASRTASRNPVVATPSADWVSASDAYALRIRQGSRPLYWEDVEVGTEVTRLHRPTLTEAEIIDWWIGSHAIRNIKRRVIAPKDEFWDSLLWRAAHIDKDVARSLGVPAPFDIGMQREAWLATTVSDWMGDHGQLLELSCRFERLNFVGDTPTCGGVVDSKSIESNQHIAELGLWIVNQRQETICSGKAKVVLPSRHGVGTPAL